MSWLRQGGDEHTRNADTFRELVRDEPSLVIPRVHWAHTTARILTVERLQGIKISDSQDAEELAKRRARLRSIRVQR
jgi:ubiquinone biosynthesis protein